jgi:hypothetical protein
MIEEPPTYAVLKGGNSVSFKQYTTTSISSSSITFSCPPPSSNIFVDRKIYMLLPTRLVINASGESATNILLAHEDAPRAFPISGSIETMQIAINGQSFSIFMADMIHALSHFNTNENLLNADYSLSPCYYDQSQNYNDLVNGIRNPLANYDSGLDHNASQRGAFPFKIVSNTPTQAVVDMVLIEPLWISPLHWGCQNAKGLYNCTTMDFNFTFLTNGNRFWSHATSTARNTLTSVNAYFSNFTAVNATPFSYSYNQPLLLFKYITPDSIQVLSPNMPLTYPYFDVQRYPTDFSISGNGTQPVNSQNLQLNSIPRMIYVYGRRNNNSLYSAIGSTYTDTYLGIESISLTFSNYSGLLSSASKHQLFLMSQKNGIGMSWNQWSGELQYPSSGFSGTQYGTIGSILAIEMATDIGLPSNSAPGLQGQYNLQMTVNFKDFSGSAIDATMYIIIVSEGSMTIPALNSCTRQLGVITQNDILDAQRQPGVSYDDIRETPYNGGNFLSNLKNFGQKLNKFLKDSHIISIVASNIPLPIAQYIGTVAHNLGYGQGGVVIDPSQYHNYYGEGEASGGKRLTKNELRKRLKNI